MLIQKELFEKPFQTKIEKRDYWVTQDGVFYNRLDSAFLFTMSEYYDS